MAGLSSSQQVTSEESHQFRGKHIFPSNMSTANHVRRVQFGLWKVALLAIAVRTLVLFRIKNRLLSSERQNSAEGVVTEAQFSLVSVCATLKIFAEITNIRSVSKKKMGALNKSYTIIK
jgi:hypothetical protein